MTDDVPAAEEIHPLREGSDDEDRHDHARTGRTSSTRRRSRTRLRYADLLHEANVDDDVKVLVIRGVGDDLGSGADLPELMAGARVGRRPLREEFGSTTTTT